MAAALGEQQANLQPHERLNRCLAGGNARQPAEAVLEINQVIKELSPWPPSFVGGEDPADANGQPTLHFFQSWFKDLCDCLFGQEQNDNGWMSFTHAKSWMDSCLDAGGVQLCEQILILLDPNGKLMTMISEHSSSSGVRLHWDQMQRGGRPRRTWQVRFPFNMLPWETQKQWQAHWNTALQQQEFRCPHSGSPFPRPWFWHPFWYPQSMERPFELHKDLSIAAVYVTPVAYIFIRFFRYLWDCSDKFFAHSSFGPRNVQLIDYAANCAKKCRQATYWAEYVWAGFQGRPSPPAPSRPPQYRKRGVAELLPQWAALWDVWLGHYWSAPGQPFLRPMVPREFQCVYEAREGADRIWADPDLHNERADADDADIFMLSFITLQPFGFTDFNLMIEAPPAHAGQRNTLDSPVGNLPIFEVTQADGVEDLRARGILLLQPLAAACRAAHFHEWIRMAKAERDRRPGWHHRAGGWAAALGGSAGNPLPVAYQLFGHATHALHVFMAMVYGGAGQYSVLPAKDFPALDVLAAWTALAAPYRPSAARFPCFEYGLPLSHGEGALVPLASLPNRAPCLAVSVSPEALREHISPHPQPAACLAAALPVIAQAVDGVEGTAEAARCLGVLRTRGPRRGRERSAVHALEPYAQVRCHADGMAQVRPALQRAAERAPDKAREWDEAIARAWKKLGAPRSASGAGGLCAAACEDAARVLAGGPFLADWEHDYLASMGRKPDVVELPIVELLLVPVRLALGRYRLAAAFFRRIKQRVRGHSLTQVINPNAPQLYSFAASRFASKQDVREAICGSLRNNQGAPEELQGAMLRELYEAHVLLLSDLLAALTQGGFLGDTELCTREVLIALHRALCVLCDPAAAACWAGPKMRARLGLSPPQQGGEAEPPPLFLPKLSALARSGYGSQVAGHASLLMNELRGACATEHLRHDAKEVPDVVADLFARLNQLTDGKAGRDAEGGAAQPRSAAPAAGAAGTGDITPPGARRAPSVRGGRVSADRQFVPRWIREYRPAPRPYEPYGGAVHHRSGEIPVLVDLFLYWDGFLHRAIDCWGIGGHLPLSYPNHPFGRVMTLYARLRRAVSWQLRIDWVDGVSGLPLPLDISRALEEAHGRASVSTSSGAAVSSEVDLTVGGAAFRVDWGLRTLEPLGGTALPQLTDSAGGESRTQHRPTGCARKWLLCRQLPPQVPSLRYLAKGVNVLLWATPLLWDLLSLVLGWGRWLPDWCYLAAFCIVFIAYIYCQHVTPWIPAQPARSRNVRHGVEAMW